MTRKELSQYFYIKKEIEVNERKLEELKAKAYSPKTQELSDMPKGGGNAGSMTERYAMEIAEYEAELHARNILLINEKRRVERFIDEIEDSKTRLVFTYRCIECMSWGEVADAMGANSKRYIMTEENARQIFSRYLKKGKNHNKNSKR